MSSDKDKENSSSEEHLENIKQEERKSQKIIHPLKDWRKIILD